jgi:hypothetical protein
LQKPDSTTDAFLLLEQDSTLAETEPITLSIHLENGNLSNTGYENPGLETQSLETQSLGNNSLDSSSLWSTFLSGASPEETPFKNSMLASADRTSLRAVDGSHNNMISDQNFISDWLDGDTIVSPSITPSGIQQLFNSKVMQPLGGPALSELMQADLYVSSSFPPLPHCYS